MTPKLEHKDSSEILLQIDQLSGFGLYCLRIKWTIDHFFSSVKTSKLFHRLQTRHRLKIISLFHKNRTSNMKSIFALAVLYATLVAGQNKDDKASSAASVIAEANAAAASGAAFASNYCGWFGVPPSCTQGCPSGYILVAADRCGGGACCTIGQRNYCCSIA